MLAVITDRLAEDSYHLFVYGFDGGTTEWVVSRAEIDQYVKDGLYVAGLEQDEIVMYRDYEELIETEKIQAELYGNDIVACIEHISLINGGADADGKQTKGYYADIRLESLLNEKELHLPASFISLGLEAPRFDAVGMAEKAIIPQSVQSLTGNLGNFIHLREIVFPMRLDAIPSKFCQGLAKLETVTLPLYLRTISSESFCNCEKLSRIKFPKGVRAIDDRAFSGCTALTGALVLTSAMHIGCNAFRRTGLTSVKLQGLVRVGVAAFANCTALRYAEIGTDPDRNMSLYQSITHEEGVEGVFSECTNLREVKVRGRGKSFASSLFRDCPNLEKVTLANCITHIPSHAFKNDTALTEIKFPKQLQTIGDYAFSNTGLRSVRFPTGMRELGQGVFCECRNLMHVDLQGCNEYANISKIGSLCFYGCDSLKQLYIPGSVLSLGSGLPQGLQELYYECSANIELFMEAYRGRHTYPELVVSVEHDSPHVSILQELKGRNKIKDFIVRAVDD